MASLLPLASCHFIPICFIFIFRSIRTGAIICTNLFDKHGHWPTTGDKSSLNEREPIKRSVWCVWWSIANRAMTAIVQAAKSAMAKIAQQGPPDSKARCRYAKLPDWPTLVGPRHRHALQYRLMQITGVQ